MNANILLMFDSPWQIMLVILVVLLLFGSARLPQLAKSLAQSKKAFKEGLEDDEREEAARREKLRAPSAEPRAALTDVDDEALFEEARRRAAQRKAEEPRRG
jgi:sec-independent protein translocase protein TatA